MCWLIFLIVICILFINWLLWLCFIKEILGKNWNWFLLIKVGLLLKWKFWIVFWIRNWYLLGSFFLFLCVSVIKVFLLFFLSISCIGWLGFLLIFSKCFVLIFNLCVIFIFLFLMSIFGWRSWMWRILLGLIFILEFNFVLLMLF